MKILTLTSLLALSTLTGCVTLPDSGKLSLDEATRAKATKVLRDGLASDEFWPSIHAAEGLTLAGHGDAVRTFLEPKLPLETDDQQRCGIARELVRAGDQEKVLVMATILQKQDDHGHVHAAESLYKVHEVGDPTTMRRRFQQTKNIRLRLMAAAALARQGDAEAFQVIRDNLKSTDEEAVRIAAWILGRIGNAGDIEPMRARLGNVKDPVIVAYLEHSMASLGDPAGLAALEKNLGSEDPAIRTYAATFAGDARATHLKGKLKKMLDDPNLDARIRAAQSLLYLERLK